MAFLPLLFYYGMSSDGKRVDPSDPTKRSVLREGLLYLVMLESVLRFKTILSMVPETVQANNPLFKKSNQLWRLSAIKN